MIAVKRLATDVINLLFPELCNACGTSLYYGEKEICIKCLYDLPYTDYHLYPDNPVAKQLWGRLNCNAAMAMLYFRKGTKVQNLMHSLKYKSQTQVGVKLGFLLGEKLKLSNHYDGIDLVIPVPLHPKKERLRGYNQSEYIAKGIAEALQIPMRIDQLLRNKSTDSQTKKSRYNRYENMQSVFNVRDKEELENLHILLVDDVITTGATLEACGNTLLNSGIKKLSIAAIAFAE
ncbi:ComF family protein [Pedobacter polaris]|uniref:ComF family protein n=1 Tax=Pedobacter polaris TaxID=2571273 RepID=A0A4U1CZ93_9SPHI|nr:phosphoribosyltransferase family protein [Pedobacter polaris]TKC13089.1 ComF family protein [Pedobacter polaris]